MGNTTYHELSQFSAILSFIDSIFRELNMGLLIYHMEDPEQVSSLKLIYANTEASVSTAADLKQVVGKPIFEAFPNLEATRVPGIFAEVVRDKVSRRIGQVDYGDDRLRPASYRVRAFPMPSNCVGVLFERI